LSGGIVLITGAFWTNFGAGPAMLLYGGVGIAEAIQAFLNYHKLKKANISLK